MLIRYDIQTDDILFINRNNYKVIHNTYDNIRDVGTKLLPINLHEVFNIADKLLRSNNNALKSFMQSNSVTPSVYNIINNNIIEYNNKEHDIYTRCHNFNSDLKEMLKCKAQGELVDIHFFPVRNHKADDDYVRYNLRNALFTMIQMERALQWLIGYNMNCQYIIQDSDVEATLWKVANIICTDQQIKHKQVYEALDYYKNVMDKSYIASKFRDYMWNVNMFIGKDTFLKDITNFEHYDRNKYVNVYLYGDKKLYNWKSIKHRVNDSLCLFVPTEHRMMLKRVKNSMTGHQFHEYLKSLIGQWFDLEGKNWTNLRQYMKRIDDSSLDSSMNVDVCKVALKDFFNYIGNLCYNNWEEVNEEMPVKNNNLIAELTQQQSENNDVSGQELSVIDVPVADVVIPNKPDDTGLNYIERPDWRNDDCPFDTEDPDFFKKLSL